MKLGAVYLVIGFITDESMANKISPPLPPPLPLPLPFELFRSAKIFFLISNMPVDDVENINKNMGRVPRSLLENKYATPQQVYI